MNFLLQSFGRSPVFGIADKDGGRGLDHHPALGDANLLRRRQNFERADGFVDLGVGSERQTDEAGENPFNNLHDVGEWRE